MKQAILVCVLCLLILVACENPMTIGMPQLANVVGDVRFISSLYSIVDSDFTPGYANGMIRSNMIQLKWTQCTDPDFYIYRLYRGENLLKTFSRVDSVSYWDINLTANSWYQYRIVTFIKNGRSSENTILLKTPSFSVPTNLSFSYQNSITLKLSWINNTETANRCIVEKTVPGQDPVIFNAGSTTYFIDNQVMDGNTYHYRVKLASPYEETEFSNSYTLQFVYYMNSPNLNGIIQMPPTTNVRLSWADNSSGETQFHIYRSIGNADYFTKIGQVADNLVEYIDTSEKTVGQVYFYYIKAYNPSEQLDSNILSIEITEQTYVLYDFEVNNGGFVSSSGWAWGYPYWTAGGYNSYKAWATTLSSAYYPNNAYYVLTSPAMVVPDNATLSFYHTYDAESYYDGGNVQISTDGGVSWTVISPIGGYPYGSIYALNGFPGFSGSIGWQNPQFDLSAYGGHNAKFRWVFASDYTDNSLGWFIDNVLMGNVNYYQQITVEESWKRY